MPFWLQMGIFFLSELRLDETTFAQQIAVAVFWGSADDLDHINQNTNTKKSRGKDVQNAHAGFADIETMSTNDA